jgi:hypothetical protein
VALSDVFSLDGPYTSACIQALGAMLGPVELRLPDGRTVSPMYVAPWHGEASPVTERNPLLRHLSGEWACVPFGPAAAPPELPGGWRPRALPCADEDAGFDHGWIANHAWALVDRDRSSLTLAIEPPAGHALARVQRVVRLDENQPGLEVETTLHARHDVTWPVALHPTFALPAGGLELIPGASRAVHAYPVAPVRGVSRLQPGGRSATLARMPLADGTLQDVSRLPLPFDTEELLQIEGTSAPFTLRLGSAAPDAAASASKRMNQIDLEIDWDTAILPDVLVWISQRGRTHAPWSGRNLALGIEPCASCFDLTRVAEPDPGHPLAHRQGISLRAGQPSTLRWSLRARIGPSARATDRPS